MDGPLAFAVQDVPSEALAFSNKAEEHENEVKSWIYFRRNFFAAVVWLNSENVAGTAGVIQEGIAVDPLLAGAGWNLAILIQTKFEKSGVGEALRP
ncbi:hypothetical protein ACRN9C_12680 [Shewanella frigidimarina]|uniref:hypothetical protein n=1 Tax=Shewanella frigidimarina TaxID=56812 RepID=UPI003D7BFD92